MKLYVSKLPKSCSDCPLTMVYKDSFTKKYVLCCRCINVNVDKCKNYRTNLCPLQSLSDYTKQVRKEVCEEIREYLKNHKYKVFGDYNKQTLQHNETYICELSEINQFLDQIQGE